MTRYFLSRLQIEGFRGINNEGQPLDLKLDVDAVNSVFGPNGHGKSSIFEALLYAIYGTVPKLDDLPASERAGAYYSNRFHSSGTSTIILTLAPDDGSPHAQIRIVRDKSGVRSVDSPSGHLDPDKLLRDLRCDLCSWITVVYTLCRRYAACTRLPVRFAPRIGTHLRIQATTAVAF